MSRSVGDAAEAAAARHLQARGYRIVARNVTTKLGELDLVARDGKTTVFVEVRLRAGGGALESVTPAKQLRLRRAAQQYLIANRLSDSPARFDVLGIALSNGEPSYTLIKNAF
jgi:putative endonuclease